MAVENFKIEECGWDAGQRVGSFYQAEKFGEFSILTTDLISGFQPNLRFFEPILFVKESLEGANLFLHL